MEVNNGGKVNGIFDKSQRGKPRIFSWSMKNS